ncbi:autotransporter outer membrane beta-barrel domain-containing protein [Salmonella enterica subsp. enterica serovar Bonariensis]|nr:autotransporter outer membrane beta-barrel domain-containing protein [Salmonella enterica subsp. enterica serovar Bonariensis]EAW8023320.1 autotransporter outer membrane beta-barrel domain-containing protein [Salmonella enterica]EBU3703936.1 autotransporter outer membrane beta-barrel domain-containing protein [Salmonella enterica]EDQ0630419.1 autotransporter outer membrane beta-barrel domain-containing protein [Salmonella enterica]
MKHHNRQIMKFSVLYSAMALSGMSFPFFSIAAGGMNTTQYRFNSEYNLTDGDTIKFTAQPNVSTAKLSISGSGILNIDGKNSLLTFDNSGVKGQGDMLIAGKLNITNGGGFNAFGTDPRMQVGVGSEGSVIVSGTESYLTVPYIVVGNTAKGNMSISDGAAVALDTLKVGYQAEGDVLVSGKGATLTVNSDSDPIRLGFYGANGRLTVNNSATVTTPYIVLGNDATNHSGKLIIGSGVSEPASEAGIINANEIKFRNKGILTLNHTNNDFNLTSDLSSSGESNITGIFSGDYGLVQAVAGTTILSGNNEKYNGSINIENGAGIVVSEQKNLGTSVITDNGLLTIDTTTDWQLTNDVSGDGNVRKTGTGSLTVGNNAAWTGQTDIDVGTLIVGKADAPVMLASSQVNIAKDGILTGFGGVTGNVTNSGTLDLRADAPGNVLTVGGNYTGNNGTLLMNTVLGDDSSATDKLVIKGDASGQTRVAVTNAGGTGAQTLNGIELVHVDGNADSAEFVQAGRIAAGAYDYTLGRGQGSNSGNWYLTSGKNTPEPDSKPEPAPGGYDNDLRPEAGSYTANMTAANTMFVTRLHERLGPVQYTDVMTGETKNTSMWMRHEGGHNRWRDGTGQLKTQGNRYVVQLGGDIAQWGWGETDRWHLGVMAGYGNDHNNTDSVRTGYRSKGSVNGYSTGLYATWFANDETHNGAYLDTWAQYGWFDNRVKGDGLPGESWKSKGLTASLETGYTWKAGEFSGSHGSLNEWYVQPQAQVVWMGVKADEHRESNGTRVENTGDDNVRTRLGVKTWIKGHNRMDDGKSREFRPFVEVNWLHNTREFGTRMNGVTVHQDGTRNIGEVKAGVEGQINDRLNLWGNVGVQAGDKGYSDTSAMLGVKYTF